MDAERRQRAADLFAEAIALTPLERDAFLERKCLGDRELIEEIRSLLAHHKDESASHFMGVKPNLASLADELRPDDIVHHYRIAKALGEGGMGIVYLAEQAAPVRRKVALKIIRVGMDTKELLARFETERQSLALMDHPAIARIYDAGATERGRPYFAMEYVDGVPITEYCDTRHLDVAARLRLFIDACNAIHHAHQRGIIHRDIKPSNVLVTEYEGKPIPKVIDFGIARATDQSLSGETMLTRRGVMLGTPAYMSPEQANPLESPDTRTDVYSLGAVLYELLTGVPPLQFGERERLTDEAIRKMIVETDPPRPSSRLNPLDANAAEVAAKRQTDVKHIVSLLRTDLDWIVVRALEKDRTRRYGSASELAADVQRYLDREPVVARPPTVRYRVQKYVRKHRFLVAAASAVLVVVVAGIATTMWQAREARQRTQDLEDIAARLVTHFYELSDYPGAMAAKQTLADLATQTLDELARRQGDDIVLKRQLASAYEGLGQLLGDNYSASLGQTVMAIEAKRKGLEIREELLRNNPTDFDLGNEYLKSWAGWGSASVYIEHNFVVPSLPWHAEVHPIAQQRRDRKMILSLSDDVASELAWSLGRTDSMMSYIQRARARREALLAEEPDNIEYQRLLADTYDRLAYVTEDIDEAERLARRAVEFCMNYYRARPFSWKASMDVAYTRRNLGYVLWRKGDLEGGLEQQRLGLDARRRLASADTLNVRGLFLLSEGYSLVGQAFLRLGEADSSIHYSQAALALLNRLERRPNTPEWTNNELAFVHSYLANAFQDLGDDSSAELHYRKAIACRGTQVGYDPLFGLVIYRMVEEYAHFLDQREDHQGSVAQHRVIARVLIDVDRRLVETGGSQMAFCDIIAGLCHTGEYVASHDPAYADSLYALAMETAQKRLNRDHELAHRVASARERVRSGAVDEYQPDSYARAAWTLSKRNIMWGNNKWPGVAPRVSSTRQSGVGE